MSTHPMIRCAASLSLALLMSACAGRETSAPPSRPPSPPAFVLTESFDIPADLAVESAPDPTPPPEALTHAEEVAPGVLLHKWYKGYGRERWVNREQWCDYPIIEMRFHYEREQREEQCTQGGEYALPACGGPAKYGEDYLNCPGPDGKPIGEMPSYYFAPDAPKYLYLRFPLLSDTWHVIPRGGAFEPAHPSNTSLVNFEVQIQEGPYFITMSYPDGPDFTLHVLVKRELCINEGAPRAAANKAHFEKFARVDIAHRLDDDWLCTGPKCAHLRWWWGVGKLDLEPRIIPDDSDGYARSEANLTFFDLQHCHPPQDVEQVTDLDFDSLPLLSSPAPRR